MMWNHGGWGAGQWVAMSFMMAIFWTLVVAAGFWLVRSAGWGRHSNTPSSREALGADEVLAQRFVRGEIDRDEFAQRHATDTRPAG